MLVRRELMRVVQLCLVVRAPVGCASDIQMITMMDVIGDWANAVDENSP